MARFFVTKEPSNDDSNTLAITFLAMHYSCFDPGSTPFVSLDYNAMATSIIRGNHLHTVGGSEPIRRRKFRFCTAGLHDSPFYCGRKSNRYVTRDRCLIFSIARHASYFDPTRPLSHHPRAHRRGDALVANKFAPLGQNTRHKRWPWHNITRCLDSLPRDKTAEAAETARPLMLGGRC